MHKGSERLGDTWSTDWQWLDRVTSEACTFTSTLPAIRAIAVPRQPVKSDLTPVSALPVLRRACTTPKQVNQMRFELSTTLHDPRRSVASAVPSCSHSSCAAFTRRRDDCQSFNRGLIVTSILCRRSGGHFERASLFVCTANRSSNRKAFVRCRDKPVELLCCRSSHQPHCHRCHNACRSFELRCSPAARRFDCVSHPAVLCHCTGGHAEHRSPSVDR